MARPSTPPPMETFSFPNSLPTGATWTQTAGGGKLDRGTDLATNPKTGDAYLMEASSTAATKTVSSSSTTTTVLSDGEPPTTPCPTKSSASPPTTLAFSRR